MNVFKIINKRLRSYKNANFFGIKDVALYDVGFLLIQTHSKIHLSINLNVILSKFPAEISKSNERINKIKTRLI